MEKEPLIRPEAEYVYSKEVEEIALRAAEMKEFKDAVGQAKNKIEAIKAVREILLQHFPEIERIPEPKIESQGLMPPTSNEFKIAKHIVDLLYEKT
jgi:hypothetical protein